MALALLGSWAALGVDFRLALWALNDQCPAAFKKATQLSECLGHAYGALAIGAIVFQLDVARRRTLPRLLASSLGAGLWADGLKLCVARVRPHHADLSGTVWASFGEWFTFGQGGSNHQSFPSGHTAVAVGLAFALARLYPRGRALFATLAVLVACHRVVNADHFLSDVLFSVALGSLWSTACGSWGPLARCFDRWEARGGRAA